MSEAESVSPRNYSNEEPKVCPQISSLASLFLFTDMSSMKYFWAEISQESKGAVVKCCGSGTVGRAVASDTRDPRFKSQHRLIIYVSAASFY